MRSAAAILAIMMLTAARAAEPMAAPAPAPNAPPFPKVEETAPGPSTEAAPAVSPASVSPASASAAQGARGQQARARGRTCFNQAETRDKIAQRRLFDPVRAMRAGRAEGEPLRTRLCRWKGDDLLYEVYVLRHDGRVVRLFMNAQSGASIEAADAWERKPAEAAADTKPAVHADGK